MSDFVYLIVFEMGGITYGNRVGDHLSKHGARGVVEDLRKHGILFTITQAVRGGGASYYYENTISVEQLYSDE